MPLKWFHPVLCSPRNSAWVWQPSWILRIQCSFLVSPQSWEAIPSWAFILPLKPVLSSHLHRQICWVIARQALADPQQQGIHELTFVKCSLFLLPVTCVYSSGQVITLHCVNHRCESIVICNALPCCRNSLVSKLSSPCHVYISCIQATFSAEMLCVNVFGLLGIVGSQDGWKRGASGSSLELYCSCHSKGRHVASTISDNIIVTGNGLQRYWKHKKV